MVLLCAYEKTLPPRKDEGSALVVPPCFDNRPTQPDSGQLSSSPR